MRAVSHVRHLLAALLLLSGAARAEPLPEVGDALTYETEDGRFSIAPFAQLQTLVFVGQDLDGGAGEGAFVLRRARLGVEGTLFTKDLYYQVEGNWDFGQPAVQDAFVRYRFHDQVYLQAGWMKRPFSRDFIISSTTNLTFERAAPHDPLLIGRDVGVMLHNNYSRSPDGIEYVVGVFNGNGDQLRFTEPPPGFDVTHVPAVFHPLLLARVAFNHGGIDGYAEGDLDGGPLRLSVGMGGIVDLPTATNAGSASAEVDFAVKAYGAYGTGAVFLESPALDGSGGDGQVGGHLKASYTLGEALLPFLSWGAIAPLGGTTSRHEVGAGAALLLFGWNARLMTAATYGVEFAGASTRADVRVNAGINLNL